MITIYSDFHQLKQIKRTRDTFIASRIQDYVPLRQWLRHALDKVDNDHEVYVQLPILEHWLRDLRDYSPQLIKWREIRLDSYFEQRFGFPPPRELPETAQQDLIHTLEPSYNKSIVDPIGWILGKKINSIWEGSPSDKQHLANVAANILKGKAIPSMFLSLVKLRIAQWAEQDNRYQIFLDNTLKEAAEEVFLGWALRSYPANPLVDQNKNIAFIEDCSQHTDIGIECLKKHNIQIKRFWSAQISTDIEPDLMQIVNSMSGLANAELDAIDRLARKYTEQLTNALIENIKIRFSHLSHTKDVIEKLGKIATPLIPNDPVETWSAEQWLDWVADDYMPYFMWILRTKRSREKQMKLAYQFEEWLIKNYSQLSQNSQAPFSPHQLNEIKESFKSHKVDIVLWFIVDGLTWWQGKKLADFCIEREINSIHIQPAISALPTITSISKNALINGYLDASTMNQPPAHIIKNRLAKEVTNIQVFTQANDLEQAYATDLAPGLYTLLYNALDHHSHTLQGFTDDESIDGHLQLIARLIKEGFARSMEQGLHPRAFISSDHGSTLLPEKATVLKIPQFAYMLDDDSSVEEISTINKVKPFQRTRVCATNNMPNESDLRSISTNWYFLQKDVFNLSKQFLIPKGYSAVERRPTGWTHGGATPEEVVVANLELQPSLEELIAPILQIEGSLRTGTISKLETIIKNPNNFPLKIIQFSIDNVLVPMKPTRIGANSTILIPIQVQTTSNQSDQYIKWFLSYERGGQHTSIEGSVNIQVRRLYANTLDDMFEEL
ncbi:hypothetical protein [Ktedonobacter racemifer]|uniref:PglZ domain protein n=1 Tax=Ktedonobacter racemifer DSM 44963 TaxID=485913 RepID=D6TX54_KTERA|nr:hypothetical protein [Ktedonobacter racemifer]EFH84787.1 PglZ domain protein [Ktedonobacter racemifer DSM 44963]